MIDRLAEGIEDVTQQAQRGSDQNQRVKPDETDAEELNIVIRVQRSSYAYTTTKRDSPKKSRPPNRRGALSEEEA